MNAEAGGESTQDGLSTTAIAAICASIVVVVIIVIVAVVVVVVRRRRRDDENCQHFGGLTVPRTLRPASFHSTASERRRNEAAYLKGNLGKENSVGTHTHTLEDQMLIAAFDDGHQPRKEKKDFSEENFQSRVEKNEAFQKKLRAILHPETEEPLDEESLGWDLGKAISKSALSKSKKSTKESQSGRNEERDDRRNQDGRTGKK